MYKKGSVDHSSPALCAFPSPPSRPIWNDPFCSERVTMHCQWGGKNPKTAHSPWDFVTLSEEDRATAIGNVYKKLLKIARVGGSGDTLADRQTDRHTYVLVTILRHLSRGRSNYPTAERSIR